MTIAPPRYALIDRAVRPARERVWAIFSANVRLRGLRAAPLVLICLGFLATFLPLLLILIFASIGFGAGPTLSSFYQGFAGDSIALLIFSLLLTTVVGAGIIADDLRSKSISLYLSRPITVLDYLAGKASVLGALLAFLAILPGVLTALIVGLLGDVSGIVAAQAAGVFVGVGLLMVLTLTGVGVLLSSLTERRSFAGAGIFATLLSVEVMSALLAGALNNISIEYLSPWEDLLAVARLGFGVSPTGSALDPYVSLAILIALIPTLFGLALLRLSRLEVMTD